MSDKIIIAGQLSGYTPKKDRTLSLRFNTQEYSEDQLIRFNRLLDSYGFICFKSDDAFTSSEMDELDSIEVDILDKAKSPSKRLRSSMYVRWSKTRSDEMTFKEFYDMQMEKYIRHEQDQIPEV